MAHPPGKKGALAVLLVSVSLVGLLALWSGLAATTQATDVESSLPAQAGPAPRYGHTLVWIDGDAYLFGGVVETTTLASDSLRSSPAPGPDRPSAAPCNDLWKMNGVQRI